MNVRQILYIDDDDDDQELFQMAIAEIDNEIECISAFDATDALKKLLASEWKPDLIFLDLNMPNMNGHEFLKQLRTKKDLDRVDVIVLSTTSHPSIVQTFQELGIRDFITKPGSYPELVGVLQLCLGA